jgi:ATP-dependent RNA helicase DDX27
MAPPTKRKADDFVFTLSDNEDGPISDLEEGISASPPPTKKRKRIDESSKSASKSSKKNKNGKPGPDNEVEEENEGIWGAKEEDDGAMDSEFEFALEADEGDNGMDEFEGWGLESAKNGLNGGDKKGVDIDEIIARRREKENGGKKAKVEEIPEAGSDVESDTRMTSSWQRTDSEWALHLTRKNPVVKTRSKNRAMKKMKRHRISQTVTLLHPQHHIQMT